MPVRGLYEVSGHSVYFPADEIERLGGDAPPTAGDGHDGRGGFAGKRVRAHPEGGPVEPQLVHQRSRGDDALFGTFARCQEFPAVRPWYEAIHRQGSCLVTAQKRPVQQLHDPTGAVVVLAVPVSLPGQGLDDIDHRSPFLVGQSLVRQIVVALLGLHLGHVLEGIDLAKRLIIPSQPVPEVGVHLLENGHRVLEAVIAQWLAKRLVLVVVGLQEGGGEQGGIPRKSFVRVEVLRGDLREKRATVVGNGPFQP